MKHNAAGRGLAFYLVGIAVCVLAVLMLPGCASIESAGTSSLSVRPVDIGGQPRCCAVEVRDGKQYASVDVLLERTGEDYRLHLKARGVEAFGGQAMAANAATGAVSAVAKVGTAAIVAPAAAAVGAAAIGALAQ